MNENNVCDYAQEEPILEIEAPNERIINYLDQDPEEEDIELVKNKDGVIEYRYLPYRVIVKYLNELCGHSWSISNFKAETQRFKKIWMSGSIELSVNYGGVFRVLSGCATFEMASMMPNTHWWATLKSLSLGNAASILGRRFGLYLNDDISLPVSQNDEEEPKDPKIERVKKLIDDCNTVEELESYGKYAIPVELKGYFEAKLNWLNQKQ